MNTDALLCEIQTRRVEVLEGDRLSLELQSKRLEIRMRVQSAFADALYWQQVIEAWEGAVQIAENGLAISRARVDAGDTIDSANLLREDILPQAQSVLDGFETRYAEGDVSLIEILPVRRDATTLRLNYLDALRDVMQTWAQLSPYYP